MPVPLGRICAIVSSKSRRSRTPPNCSNETMPTDPPTGERRYERIRKISSGGFGYVDLCKDRVTGEYVAVKHIERGLKVDKHALYEIMNHRNLLHHHVIQFRETYLTAHDLCIVMDYAPGGDLLKLVTRKNGLSEREARWFFQQLIIGLDYIHKMGVASRDIKLENAVLDSRKWPLLKICDFGYSKNEKVSKPSSRVGTPGYVAPEVISSREGNKYDGKKADIWSSGACLYAMIFASYPFDSPIDWRLNTPDKLQRMLERIVNEAFRVPQHPPISPDLRNLLYKIMVKDPGERITLEEIMHHPWFQIDLPRGAMDMNKELKEQKSGIQTEKEIRCIVESAKVPFSGNEFGVDYIDHVLSDMPN